MKKYQELEDDFKVPARNSESEQNYECLISYCVMGLYGLSKTCYFEFLSYYFTVCCENNTIFTVFAIIFTVCSENNIIFSRPTSFLQNSSGKG